MKRVQIDGELVELVECLLRDRGPCAPSRSFISKTLARMSPIKLQLPGREPILLEAMAGRTWEDPDLTADDPEMRDPMPEGAESPPRARSPSAMMTTAVCLAALVRKEAAAARRDGAE